MRCVTLHLVPNSNLEGEQVKTNCRILIFAASVLLTAAVPGLSTAQQVTGVLGSPSATTTVSNKQLPAPDPKFGGVIKNDALQSKIWWAPRVVPPKGAPNVLLIITDDAGFGSKRPITIWLP